MADKESLPAPESVFDEDQQQFLENLKQSPVWQSIIDRLSKDFFIPTYRPGQDPHKQFYNWMTACERKREREQLILLLTNGDRGVSTVLDSEG